MANHPPKGYKRITISLPDDVATAVENLATIQGVPQSKVVVSILTEFAPTMHGLAKIHKQLQEGEKAAAKQTVQHMLGDAMAELLGEQMELAPPKKGRKSPKFPLPPAKVQAYADTNGIPPKV